MESIFNNQEKTASEEIRNQLLSHLNLAITSVRPLESLLPANYYINVNQLINMPGKNPKNKERLVECLTKLAINEILDRVHKCNTSIEDNTDIAKELIDEILLKLQATIEDNNRIELTKLSLNDLEFITYELHFYLHVFHISMKKAIQTPEILFQTMSFFTKLLNRLKHTTKDFFDARPSLGETLVDTLYILTQVVCFNRSPTEQLYTGSQLTELTYEFLLFKDQITSWRHLFEAVLKKLLVANLFIINDLTLRFSLEVSFWHKQALHISFLVIKIIEFMIKDDFMSVVYTRFTENKGYNLFQNALKLISLNFLPYEKNGEGDLLSSLILNKKEKILKLAPELHPEEHLIFTREKSPVEWELVLTLPALLEVLENILLSVSKLGASILKIIVLDLSGFLAIALKMNHNLNLWFEGLFGSSSKIFTLIKTIISLMGNEGVVEALVDAFLNVILQGSLNKDVQATFQDIWHFLKNYFLQNFDDEVKMMFFSKFAENLVKVEETNSSPRSSKGLGQKSLEGLRMRSILAVEEIAESYFDFLKQINDSDLMKMSATINNYFTYFINMYPALEMSGKDMIIRCFQEIYNKRTLFQNLLMKENIINNLFNRAFSRNYQDIFLNFMNKFYSGIMPTDNDPFYRNHFFQKTKEYLNYMRFKMDFEPDDLEFHRKKVLFFCIMFQKLIFQEEVDDFIQLFRRIQSCTHSETLFSDKKNKEYSEYFITSLHYEALLNLLENQNFQTREILFEILHLTYALHNNDIHIRQSFKDMNYHLKILKLVSLMHYNAQTQFTDFEVVNLLNMFMNLATNAEFFYIIERNLISNSALAYPIRKTHVRQSEQSSSYVITLSSEKTKSLTDIILPSSPSVFRGLKEMRRSLGASSFYFCSDKSFDINSLQKLYESEFSIFACYVRIQNPIFIDILMKYLFEVQTYGNVKDFYLTILRDFVKNSLYNSIFLGKDKLVEHLLFYLRLEPSEEFKAKLVDILTSILCANISIHQLRSTLRNLDPVFMLKDIFIDEYNPFLCDPRIKELESYSNFFQSSKFIFNLIENLMNSGEKESDCLNFSGQGSGILIKNVEDFPSQNFSLIIECMFDNLHTSNKKRIHTSYRRAYQSYIVQKFDDYSIVQQKIGTNPMDKNHFQKLSSGTEKELYPVDIDVMPDDDREENEPEDFNPRLVSFIGKNDSVLEIYVENDFKQGKRYLNVEVFSIKKTIVKQRFPYEFKERVWYSIAIVCNKDKEKENGTFSLFVDTLPVTSFERRPFGNFMKEFDQLKYITVGSKPPASLKLANELYTSPYESNPKLKRTSSNSKIRPSNHCFSGLIKSFYLIDRDLNKDSLTNFLKIQSKGTYEIKGNQKDSTEEFYSSVRININAFSTLEKHTFGDDKGWFFLSNADSLRNNVISCNDSDDEKNTQRTSFFGKIIKKLGSNDQNFRKRSLAMGKQYDIKSKGVTLLERSSIQDVFFSMGNIDVYLYIIDMYTNIGNSLSYEDSCQIISLAIKAIKSLYLAKGLDVNGDIHNFFDYHGFWLMNYLLKKYFDVIPCSNLLFETLTDFVKTVNTVQKKGSEEDKDIGFRAFICLILNFELYLGNHFSIMERIIDQVYIFLDDDRILQNFKEKHKTEYLFYALNKYFNIKKEYEDIKAVYEVNPEINWKEYMENIFYIRQSMIVLIKYIMLKKPSEATLTEELGVLFYNICLINDSKCGSSLIQLLRLFQALNAHLSNSQFESLKKKAYEKIPVTEIILRLIMDYRNKNIKVYNDFIFVEEFKAGQSLSDDEFYALMVSLIETIIIDLPGSDKPFVEITEAQTIIYSLNCNMKNELGMETQKALHNLLETSINKKLDIEEQIILIFISRFQMLSLDLKINVLEIFKTLLIKFNVFVTKFAGFQAVSNFLSKSYTFLKNMEDDPDKIKWYCSLVESIVFQILLSYMEDDQKGIIKIQTLVLEDPGRNIEIFIKGFTAGIGMKVQEKKNYKNYIINKKEQFLFNLIHIVFLLEDLLIKFPNEILKDLRLLYNLIENMKEILLDYNLLYCTMPKYSIYNMEIKVDIIEAGDKLGEDQYHMKNGGVLRSFLTILLKILSVLSIETHPVRSSEQEDVWPVIKLINSILLPSKHFYENDKNPGSELSKDGGETLFSARKGSKDDRKNQISAPNTKKPSPNVVTPLKAYSHKELNENIQLIKLINHSNKNYKRVFPKLYKKFTSLISKRKKNSDHKSIDSIGHLIYDYVFYELYMVIHAFYKRINLNEKLGKIQLKRYSSEQVGSDLSNVKQETKKEVAFKVPDDFRVETNVILRELIFLVKEIVSLSGDHMIGRLRDNHLNDEKDKYYKKILKKLNGEAKENASSPGKSKFREKSGFSQKEKMAKRIKEFNKEFSNESQSSQFITQINQAFGNFIQESYTNNTTRDQQDVAQHHQSTDFTNINVKLNEKFSCFVSVVEFCKVKDPTRQIDTLTTLNKLFSVLWEKQEEFLEQILPCLYSYAVKKIKIVEKLSKLEVKLKHEAASKMHKQSLNFYYQTTKKKNEEPLDNLNQKVNKMYDEYLDSYIVKLKNYEEQEKINSCKLNQIWQHLKSKLLNDRGIWRQSDFEVTKIYKIDKFEDSLRRKYHLKIFKKANEKEYVNLITFNERLRKLKKNIPFYYSTSPTDNQPAPHLISQNSPLKQGIQLRKSGSKNETSSLSRSDSSPSNASEPGSALMLKRVATGGMTPRKDIFTCIPEEEELKLSHVEELSEMLTHNSRNDSSWKKQTFSPAQSPQYDESEENRSKSSQQDAFSSPAPTEKYSRNGGSEKKIISALNTNEGKNNRYRIYSDLVVSNSDADLKEKSVYTQSKRSEESLFDLKNDSIILSVKMTPVHGDKKTITEKIHHEHIQSLESRLEDANSEIGRKITIPRGMHSNMPSQDFSPKLRRENSLGFNTKHSTMMSIKQSKNLSHPEEENIFVSKKECEEKITDKEFTKFPPKDQKGNNKKERTLLVNKFDAEKVTLKGSIWGEIEVNEKFFTFNAREDERPDEPKFCLGSLKSNLLKNIKKKKRWAVADLNQIHARSFNLRNCAVEIFTIDSKSYFFNVFTTDDQEKLINLIKKLNKHITYSINRREAFEKSKITEKWLEGKISNFEYLMKVNTYAGRTFNDINQYPVFPWILCNYEDENLNIDYFNDPKANYLKYKNDTQAPNNQSNKYNTSLSPLNINENNKGNKQPEAITLEPKKYFRDLSLPIGAQNKERLAYFIERMESYIGEDPPFHYGTHYSGAGNVMHFLIRLEPFTSLCTELQSGKFDHPDRLFWDIGSAWNSCLTNTADVKELIPEFFFFPDFLRNKNKFDFGSKQTGEIVDDVRLPKWAKTPEEFVFKHREALESKFVTQNLHNWIDLIFGSKQRDEAAKESYNLFYYLTYEGKRDLTKETDKNFQSALLAQISNYGQTPHQLFKEAHPANSCDNVPMMLYMDPTRFTINVLETLDSSIFSLSNNSKGVKALTFKKKSYNLTLKIEIQFPSKVAINKGTNLGKFFFNEYNPQANVYHFFSASASNLSTQGAGNITQFIVVGYDDNNIRMFRGEKEIKTNSNHKKLLTCVSVSEEHNILACGSKDCRISLWKINDKKPDPLKKFTFLYGHQNEIVALKLNGTLGILVSADKDGICLVHSMVKGRYLRSFRPPLDDDEIITIIDIHSNGLIVMATTENRILLYNLNADVLSNKKIHSLDGKKSINQLEFFSKNYSADIIFSTTKGQLLIYNSFRLDNGPKVNYPKLSDEDQKDGSRRASSLDCFCIDHGYSNSVLAALNLTQDAAKLQLVHRMKEFGF